MTHEFLHHTLSILLALPTWVGPLLFLPIARRQLAQGGPRQLWRACLLGVLAFAAYAAVGWYIAPDGAGWPLAAIASEVVLIAPPLAVISVVLQETRGTTLPEQRRLALAGVLGMAALLLCFMPAALISGVLGGSMVGSDPC